MSKKWINISKSVIFLLIIGMILFKVLDVLNYKDIGGGGGWQRFYEMPEETIDVVFFGSSHMHCTVDHGVLWDEYGIAGYTLSAGAQHLDSTYYFMKEVLEVQRPKLLVVEVWGTVLPGLENSDESVYRNSLGMRWSSNLWEFVNHLTEDIGKDKVYRNRIFSKMPVVHSRYAELTKDDFVDDMPYMMGYRGSFEKAEYEQPSQIAKEITMPLNEKCEEYLYKIIQLAKEYDTELLFIASPYILSDEEQMLLNETARIAEEESIPMINYNQVCEEIGLDYRTDFRDEAHLNNYGASKVTSHLGAYMKDNYEIPDRKGQAGYEAWELNSRYLDGKWEANALVHAQDVNSYLRELSALEEKTVVLSLTGNHTAAGDVYYESLAALGISYEDYMNGGVWVFENRVPTLYLPGKEYNQCYKVAAGEIHCESKVVQDGTEEQQTEIIFEGKNYSNIKNGINVLVYDQMTGQIIDAAGVDIYIGFDVVREEGI